MCRVIKSKMCHVFAKHCSSTPLGIRVVTLNLRLHDTRSQNTSRGKSKPSQCQMVLFSRLELLMTRTDLKNYLIKSHLIKALQIFRTTRFDLLFSFFLFQRQRGIIPSPFLFPRSQHVCGSMCLSFPVDAAESLRFSCNTLVNSPACRVIAVRAPVSVYPQFWLILSFSQMSLLLCVTKSAPPIHTQILTQTDPLI